MTSNEYCSRYMDDMPGIRADCWRHIGLRRKCETCPHRDIRTEVQDLRARLAGETSCSAAGPLGSVALSAKEKQLTEALAHADAINSVSVNRIYDLEHANRTLVARVDRLRDRIHSAYDVLAAASSEDAMTLPVKT